MIKEIENGYYDGIIAWAPDRLARNMREGGLLIDMLDKGTLKDLKFVSHHFENTPSGKMLLGIAFVLEKQYSDQLSQAVTLGFRNITLEGKGHKVKHGYYIDNNDRLRADGRNYNLIKKAWEMRISGGSKANLDNIAAFLNKELMILKNYSSRTSHLRTKK